MRHAADLTDFLAQPLGRCFGGPTWLYFYPREDLCGFSLWGRPDVDAIERLVRVLRVELDAAPHASLVDAQALESVDAAAFDALGAYVQENHEALSRVVRRLALLPPRTGLMRAVTAGFFRVASAPYPVELFDDAVQALEWLGAESPSTAADAIRAAQGRAMGLPSSIRELRGWIEGNLGDASLENAARSLGLSTRSLQRRLKDAGTSFQQEVKLTQVAVAQRMLRDTDAAITRVALEVGLTPAHFSALFKAVMGLSPREWRERSGRR